MKQKAVSQSEILELSTRPEGHFYDRKAKELDGKKIQKIVVALANADGGDFVVGIKDDRDESDVSKRWDGATDMEYYNKVFQNILEIKPSIPYTPTFLFNDHAKTYCLLITVEKSEKVHSTSDNTVYIRVSSQSIPLKELIVVNLIFNYFIPIRVSSCRKFSEA